VNLADVHPRRIGLFLESDGPGGAEMMLLQLACELRRRGHSVLHIGPRARDGWLGSRFADEGFRTTTYSLRAPVDPLSIVDFARLFRREQLDLVNGHEFTAVLYGTAGARLAGIPHVATMHGADYVLNATRRRLAMRWAFGVSRGVIGVSKETAAFMAERLKMPLTAITAIANGISARPGDRQRGRQTLGLAEETRLVLAVGNLHSRKGHRFLIDAMHRVGQIDPQLDWCVAIAGRGDQEPALQQQIVAAGLEGRVRLLGHRDDIPDLLAASDVFAMPSEWEGLPVAMLEAMFAARPVVASAVSGIPEAVRDGIDGLLTAPGDVPALSEVLHRLLLRADERVRFGEAGRLRAEERFTIAAMVDQYETVYGWRAAATHSA